jgi:hypothetical protein
MLVHEADQADLMEGAFRRRYEIRGKDLHVDPRPARWNVEVTRDEAATRPPLRV